MVAKWKPKAIVGIAAAAMALGALSATPAQAATTCNSERICFTQPNGNITNVDVGAVPLCGPTTYPGAIGNASVRNRSDVYWVALYYDFNGDGQVGTGAEEVAYLGPNESATLNPNSRYYYCLTF